MTIDAFAENPQVYEAIGITEEGTAIGKEVVLDEEPIVEKVELAPALEAIDADEQEISGVAHCGFVFRKLDTSSF